MLLHTRAHPTAGHHQQSGRLPSCCPRLLASPHHAPAVRRRRSRLQRGCEVRAAAAPGATTTPDTSTTPTTNGSVTSTSTSTTTSSSRDDSLLRGFEWQSHWWPVAVSATTDTTKPHAVQLLGRQLVLWKSSEDSGKWVCSEDACPHRLAPLSQGRIESDGTLQCAYHGWRFNAAGSCTEIPQALDDKAKAVACASSRSCVTTFPVQEAFGLVWVWPTAGPAAEAAAAAAPLPVSKGLVEVWNSKPNGHHKWYRRELNYSFASLVENLSDPSHLPFSHHKLTPVMLRHKAGAMPFTQLQVPDGSSPEDAAARPSYSFEHQAPLAAFSFPSVLSPNGRVCFNAPGCVVYQYDLGPTIMIQNDLLAVPAGPGQSVAFTLGLSNAPTVTNWDIVRTLLTNPKMLMPTLFRASFQRRPLFQEHLGMNKLFDQDNVFLNQQDRLLAQRGETSWQRDYYMPTPCDGLVVAVRRWCDAAYQLKLPAWPSRPGGSSSTADSPTAGSVLALSPAAAAAPQQSARQLNDRMQQHTQHCTECSRVLAGLQDKLQRAQAAAAACAAGLAGLVGAVVLPRLVAALSGLASGAGAAADSAAVVGSSSFGPLGIAAVVLGVGAVLSLAVASSTAQLIQQFVHVPFAHADNH